MQFEIIIKQPDGMITRHSTSSLAAAVVAFREEVNRYPKRDREIILASLPIKMETDK